MYNWREIIKAKKLGWFQQLRDEHFESIGDHQEEDKLGREMSVSTDNVGKK